MLPSALSFTAKVKLVVLVAIAAPAVVGKEPLVVPVTYALPEESTAMPTP